MDRKYVILVHGGAGDLSELAVHSDWEGLYYSSLEEALRIGERSMQETGKGVDVVRAVIRHFETSPLFNAGIGATVNADGSFELDACLMEGRDLSAGAVAGLRHVKHPIDAAYAVKTSSEHVFLAGEGADLFAAHNGVDTVEDNMYFATPDTMKWVDEFKARSRKNGTVGCVVLDREGNLVAGTSTGGILGKKYGRVGDSPVVGAGTYADNAGAAVSCTGHGEYFIRHNVAANINFRVKMMGQKVGDAVEEMLFHELNAEAGNGGLIAVDRNGNFALDFNSRGMFRGYLYRDGEDSLHGAVGIYREMRTI